MSADVRVLPCLYAGVRMGSQRNDQSFTELEVRHHMQSVDARRRRQDNETNNGEDNSSNPEHPVVWYNHQTVRLTLIDSCHPATYQHTTSSTCLASCDSTIARNTAAPARCEYHAFSLAQRARFLGSTVIRRPRSCSQGYLRESYHC